MRKLWILLGSVIGVFLILFLLYLATSGNSGNHNPGSRFEKLCLPPNAYNQTYEGTYNPYINTRTPWRSSGIPHAPMTFRPDNPDKRDYGSQNAITWDLEKTRDYFPHRHYNDYGMYDFS